nr:MAG TPA: hypothetical protein [Bacteriophage sp.]
MRTYSCACFHNRIFSHKCQYEKKKIFSHKANKRNIHRR